MLHLVGWLMLALLGVVIAINALYMAMSPHAWFRLPKWVRMQGSATEERFGSGWGAIQVRIAGVVVLGILCWVLYDVLRR